MTYPHLATILRKGGAEANYTFVNSGTTRCFLQPLDSQAAEAYGITFTKSSSCYVPYDTDIRTSDRLSIDGDVYGVAGVRKHNYGALSHKKLLLEAV